MSRTQTKALDGTIGTNTEFGDEIHSFRDSTWSKYGFGRNGNLYGSLRRLPFCGWRWKRRKRAPRVDGLGHSGLRCNSLDGSGGRPGGRGSRDWARRFDGRLLEGHEQHGRSDGQQRSRHWSYPARHAAMRPGGQDRIAVGMEGCAYMLILVAFGLACHARPEMGLEFGGLVRRKLVIEPGD